MSYNGSGSFLINTAGQPVVSGTVISSTAFNALTADLATGLSTCITKDGQTTVTANIPMANYKFTGLGAGSAAGDSANLSQVQSTVVKLLASVSGTDTITAVGSPTVAAYAAGQMFYFVAAGDNTGAVTINIDSLGAKAVTRDGSVALAAGDIKSGEVVVIVYDGTRFQVVSQLNSSGDARFANVSIASSLYVGGVATIVGNAGFSANVSIASALSVGGVATITGTVTGSKFVPTGNVTTGNGMYLPTTNTLAFSTNGAEVFRLDASGNAGLGVTPSTWSTGKAIQINSVQASIWGAGDQINVISNAYYDGAYKYAASKAASMYEQALGVHTWSTAASGTAGNTITFTERARITSGGSFQIGSSSGTDPRLLVYDNDSTDTAILVRQDGAAPVQIWQGSGGTELARITSGGDLLVGKTSASYGLAGGEVRGNGVGVFTVSGGTSIAVNRLVSDGNLVEFYQDTSLEGSISVSGNTVSYNAFAGSHWSQLQDGSKPDILRGTVMESINELCVWPGEVNERLPKSKISDTAGSKKVYGVFMAWDNDWTATNDMYVTAVGAFICRVNGSVTVQEGDLLESNGDGTARVQSDDIIRSSTIGKVTSTVKTHEYDDGSYCVPTVLYCG